MYLIIIFEYTRFCCRFKKKLHPHVSYSNCISLSMCIIMKLDITLPSPTKQVQHQQCDSAIQFGAIFYFHLEKTGSEIAISGN